MFVNRSPEEAKGGEATKTFTQDQVNDIVAAERKSTLEKFKDYDTLRQKVSEFDKYQEDLKNKDLESKKEYEKLKEGWSNKEKEYQQKLNEAKEQTKQRQVSYELSMEVIKQNAHADAAMLLKDQAVVGEDGTVKIKGRDQNGMETLLSVQDGLKAFLKDKPYLVKASGQGGAGTSAGTSGGNGASSNQQSLGDQLVAAKNAGDYKKVEEIRKQLRGKYANIA